MLFPWLLLSIVVVAIQIAGATTPEREKLLVILFLALIGVAILRLMFRSLREHGDMLRTQSIEQDFEMVRGLSTEPNEGESSKEYHVARSLYYMGTLTITQTVFRKAGFTLSDWIFLCSLGALVLERPPCELRISTIPRMFWLGVGLLLFGGTLSSFTAREPTASFLEVIKYFYTVVVWIWLSTVLLRNVRQVQRALSCWVISAAVSGAAAIGQIVIGIALFAGAVVGGRAVGFTEHINELGMVGAMTFLPAMMMTIDSRGAFRQSLMGVVTLLILAGLVLSVSLSSLIALGIAAAVWAIGFLHLSIIRKPAVAISILVTTITLGWILRNQSVRHIPTFVDRIENLSDRSGNGQTVYERVRTYKAAWRYIRQSPLIGVGLDPQSSKADENRGVHNMILLQWYEGGIISALGILTIFGLVWSVIWRTALDSVSYREFRLSISILFSFVAFFVYAMSTSEAHHRDAWMFAVLPLVMEALRRRRLAHIQPLHS
jgi:O-antigen ligase